MDNIQMNPEPSGSKKQVVLSLVILIALVVVGYFVYQSGMGGEKTLPSSRTEVTQTDLSPTSTSRIPAGFPTSIPVEEQNIKESFKVNYLDEGVVQYTVAFNSSLSKDELWKLYNNFFLAAGYASNNEDKNESEGTLKGWRSGNKLNITIKPQEKGSYVTINFLEMQVSVPN